MLSHFESLKEGTYGFHFKGSHQERIAGISSVGWEKRRETTYDWDGLDRSDSDIIVFQYTLKGRGEIKITDQIHRLEPGQAFIVNVPSDHRYYLPADSDLWEFIHITLSGNETMACFQSIIEQSGPILQLDFHAKPITHILKILNKVINNKITDAFEASSLAYSFLMELQRNILFGKNETNWPSSVSRTVLFIDNNFASYLTLDDIVNVSGLSKYHFTRLFHANVLSTPIQYLTKRRINESIKLLKNKNLTIDDIALMVGFSNGNYFIKVFRQVIGVPPGEYRDSSSFISVDHIIMD